MPSPLSKLFIFLILLAQCTNVDSFLVVQPTCHASRNHQRHNHYYSTNSQAIRPVHVTFSKKPFTHQDITWKIRPPPEATTLEKLRWKISANILRWESILLGRKVPTVMCPNNFSQIVLEAHTNKSSGEKPQKIGRFGITCQRGPSAPPIAETVKSLYNIDPGLSATNLGIAAIIYMVVEPTFRGRQVGVLALEVIALIHAAVNADFTILVCDDKSGKEERTLVKWYEQHGYKQAPLLQDMMGSPNEQFGVSMIAPTDGTKVPVGCNIQWW